MLVSSSLCASLCTSRRGVVVLMPRRFHGDQKAMLLPDCKVVDVFEDCRMRDGEARHSMTEGT